MLTESVAFFRRFSLTIIIDFLNIKVNLFYCSLINIHKLLFLKSQKINRCYLQDLPPAAPYERMAIKKKSFTLSHVNDFSL